MTSSKVVQAVNAMIYNDEKITEIIKAAEGDEIFFAYSSERTAYKWSMVKSTNGIYFLHYYPNEVSLREMAGWPPEAWLDYKQIVTYNTKELGTKEAIDSFAELYSLINSRVFGMNDVLDEIIEDLPTF